MKDASGPPQTRSKSPSAILGRFTNFARGKYRSSLHERSAISTSDDKQRRVRNGCRTKIRGSKISKKDAKNYKNFYSQLKFILIITFFRT